MRGTILWPGAVKRCYLDLTDSKDAYCTKLLTDLDADVTGIESPERDYMWRNGDSYQVDDLRG